MKSAVCLLLPRSLSHQHYLAVSRRNDNTRWGFPGGKVDPGESNVEALIREVGEETGLVLKAEYLEPLYSSACPGKGPDDTYWVTTYLWTGPLLDESMLQPEEGLEIEWLCSAALSDTRRSPFAGYNLGVFSALRAFQGQSA